MEPSGTSRASHAAWSAAISPDSRSDAAAETGTTQSQLCTCNLAVSSRACSVADSAADASDSSARRIPRTSKYCISSRAPARRRQPAEAAAISDATLMS
eukprot:scaffold54964_cov30-Tisochrysis_lutea.AAC.10